MNPELFVAAAKQDTRSTRTNSMKKTGMVWRSGLADVDKPVTDHDCFSVVSADPASAAIRASPPNSMPSPSKQSSYPRTNLNHCVLQPSQQTGRETNIKEVSELAACTVNSSGKRDRSAMAESDEQNRLADSLEPPRKIIRTVPTMHSTIMVEPESPHCEANQVRYLPCVLVHPITLLRSLPISLTISGLRTLSRSW